jgi:pectate lyase
MLSPAMHAFPTDRPADKKRILSHERDRPCAKSASANGASYFKPGPAAIRFDKRRVETPQAMGETPMPPQTHGRPAHVPGRTGGSPVRGLAWHGRPAHVPGGTGVSPVRGRTFGPRGCRRDRVFIPSVTLVATEKRPFSGVRAGSESQPHLFQRPPKSRWLAALFALIAGGALPAAAQQPAFPGAEGFGRYTLGGRGGDVYYVTNLNDAGPGSFREGIRSATGARTIVFGVSGTIALESPLIVNKPNLTIAGQTAPGGGITLRNYEFVVHADHVIVRYIRSRLGDRGKPSASGRDAISINHGTNIILDHCSASWSIDETLSSQSRTVDLLTVQWCLVAESLHHSKHGKGAHGYGGILGAKRQTYHHNLFAHHMRRMPNVSFRHFIQADCRNNVMYNWGDLSCYRGSNAHANWVNNYYKPGPATLPNVRRQIFQLEDVVPDLVPEIDPSFYIEGNYVEGFPEISADNWAGGVDFRARTSEALNRARRPFDYPRISCERTALEAYEAVLASVGASLWRDPVDERIIHDVRTGTATFGRNGFIDSQDEVGGWPELPSLKAPDDRDRDGMPDWWEEAHGLDPRNPMDRNLDRNGDGYTNLEEYINWLADPATHQPANCPCHPRHPPASPPAGTRTTTPRSTRRSSGSGSKTIPSFSS